MTRKHLSYTEMMARRFAADHAVIPPPLAGARRKAGAALAAARAWPLAAGDA